MIGKKVEMMKKGIRNSNIMAIAPTATISNIVGVSQSIEPTYQNLYVKSNLSGEFTVINPYLVHDLKARGLWDPVMVNDLKYYDGSVQQIERIPQERIYIADANFAGNLNRVEKICDMIIERGIKKLFILEIRISSIAARPYLVKKMEQAGFFMFLIGLESPQDRILRTLHKGFNQRVVEKGFAALRGTHIVTLGNFMIGNISETPAEMRSISQYARRLGVDLISPNKLYAYPGSEFAEIVENAPHYHIHPGRRHYVYSDMVSLHDLRNIQHQIYMRFYTPGHIWNLVRKMMLHPMVRQLGSTRMAKDFFAGLGGNFTDRRFRKRFLKKLTKRFKKKDK